MLDVDSFSRRFRKPRIETQEEINRNMLSVEEAVRDALFARGETQFTDLEFPPNDQSLYLDPDDPPHKLQVGFPVTEVSVCSLCFRVDTEDSAIMY